MDCIFCSIIKKELSAHVVYEDEFVLAFLDIAPVNYGHVLVVPKMHFSNYEEIDEYTLARVYSVVKKIGLAIKKGLESKGYNTIVNNDPVAGQIVPHFHVHIIPRNDKDALANWPQGKYGEGEAVQILQKIISNI